MLRIDKGSVYPSPDAENRRGALSIPLLMLTIDKGSVYPSHAAEEKMGGSIYPSPDAEYR
jgi:hypothetical protein